MSDMPEDLEGVCAECEQAVARDPGDGRALARWGRALLHLSLMRGDGRDVEFLQQACIRLEQAVRGLGEDHEALCEWGTALMLLAGFHDGEEEAALYREACNRYERAACTNPTDPEMLCGWAHARCGLAELAARTDPAAAVPLLRDALAKYELAQAVAPGSDGALTCSAGVLHRLGGLIDGEEGLACLRESCLRYARCVEASDACAWDYEFYGQALTDLAHRLDAGARAALLQIAEQQFAQASRMHQDDAAAG